MARLNLETVVLRGVRVACDNVNCQVGMVSQEAAKGTFTVIPSVKRHLSSKPAVEVDRGPWYPATFGGTAVPRAGRLAVLHGGLVSRHPSVRRWSRPSSQAITRICPQWPVLGGSPSRRMPSRREMMANRQRLLPGLRGM
jgi:hypothetical protein